MTSAAVFDTGSQFLALFVHGVSLIRFRYLTESSNKFQDNDAVERVKTALQESSLPSHNLPCPNAVFSHLQSFPLTKHGGHFTDRRVFIRARSSKRGAI